MKTNDIKNRLSSLDFSECEKWEDIYDVIREELRYEAWVTDDEDAEEYFEEMYGGEEFDRSDVRHNAIWRSTVTIDDKDYEVVVYEHYVDSGSVDYLYSCDLGEDNF